VRVVHHYGGRPEFVLLGGLVPALLCAGSPWQPAGTTDVDVQVDLEIAGGAVQAARLEQALRNAEFEPDAQRTWRWNFTDPSGVRTVVKFELLADLETEPQGATIEFAGCDQLGAANLRGTGYAAKDTTIHQLRAKDHGTWRLAEIYITGLAGFLLAKTAAAHSRRKPKDWYDIAFVLLNNEQGDALTAAARVREVLGEPTGAIRTQLQDLRANFADSSTQGTSAYVNQITLDHPEVDPSTAAADAILAVGIFADSLLAVGCGRRSLARRRTLRWTPQAARPSAALVRQPAPAGRPDHRPLRVCAAVLSASNAASSRRWRRRLGSWLALSTRLSSRMRWPWRCASCGLLDPDCERLVFGIRAHNDGAVLAATDDDLDELIGFVAAEANHEAQSR